MEGGGGGGEKGYLEPRSDGLWGFPRVGGLARAVPLTRDTRHDTEDSNKKGNRGADGQTSQQFTIAGGPTQVARNSRSRFSPSMRTKTVDPLDRAPHNPRYGGKAPAQNHAYRRRR